MTTTLFIPLRVRKLHLDIATPVANALSDFSRLPYFDEEKKRIINNDSPFISENVVANPFQDDPQSLGKGNHLHFILPTPFTHAHNNGDNLPVPNRWLVRKGDQSKYWIVESDYLSKTPPVTEQASITTIIPVTNKIYEPGFEINEAGDYQTFRYMGRQLEIGKWKLAEEPKEYWKDVFKAPLTAFAYGDPQFPILYPNCRSVFGFYDGDEKATALDDYYVTGWIDGEDENTRTRIIKDITTIIEEVFADKSLRNPTNIPEQNKNQLQAFFDKANGFGWEFSPKDFGIDPIDEEKFNEISKKKLADIKVVFEDISQIVFYNDSCETQADRPANPKVKLAIGNNGVEALSTYLAAKTYPDDDQKRLDLEDLLEAVQVDQLKTIQNDQAAKFAEARHAKGFKAVPGGTIWDYTYHNLAKDIVRNQELNDSSPPVSQEEAINKLEASGKLSTLAGIIKTINASQNLYEKTTNSIHSKQHQLFADWYKFMLSAHPPIGQEENYPRADEVLAFINDQLIPELDDSMKKAGLLTVKIVEEPGDQPLFIPTDTGYLVFTASSYFNSTTGEPSIARAIAKSLLSAIQEVENLNKEESLKNANLEIRLVNKPAPRYYQPNDPVLLIAGDVVPSELNQEISLPTCGFDPTVVNTLATVVNSYDPVKQSFGKSLEKYIKSTVKKDSLPWFPILLEWQAAFYPLDNQHDAGFHQDTFVNTFELPHDQIEFSPKGNAISANAISTYQGFAPLSTYATEHLTKKLKPYKDSTQTTELAAAYNKISNGTIDVLSQSLSGFNEAFLTRKESLQLAGIADPVAFDDYKPYIAKINNYIYGNTGLAPLPSYDFNPIRGGGFNLTHLNLIDTFGQKLTIYNHFERYDDGSIQVAKTMNWSNSKDLQWQGFSGDTQAFLFPRFVQPTRIHARWLSKDSDEIECGQHAPDSPICGWLVHNIMDDSLMIYATEGDLLGSIGLVNGVVAFIPKPESINPIETKEIKGTSIENKHLRGFVNFFLTQAKGAAYFTNFLYLLVNAQEYTDPESFEQHPELSLLMGHPMALTRMCLNFELQGDYAINQSWDVFTKMMRNPKAQNPTEDFEEENIPIRLGDYRQLNDGLVGFWLDGANGTIDKTSPFHSPVGGLYTSDHFKATGKKLPDGYDKFVDQEVNMQINQNLKQEPDYLTMLFDPRAQLNITTGILPVKTITIPSHLYKAALKNIRVTFLMSPFLTPKDHLQFPLPVEGGYQWKWIYYEAVKTDGKIVTKPVSIPTQATIQKAVLETNWEALKTGLKVDIWEALIQGSILKVLNTKQPERGSIYFEQVTPTNLATVLSITDSKQKTTVTQQLMQLLLNHHQGIDNIVTGAQYGAAEIREGWLELVEAPEVLETKPS